MVHVFYYGITDYNYLSISAPLKIAQINSPLIATKLLIHSFVQYLTCLCVFVFVINTCWYAFFFPFIFISWRIITLHHYSGFCRTLTWISHGFTCVPHPEHPSHLPPHTIPLGLPSAPALSTCLMHPTCTGDLFHTW